MIAQCFYVALGGATGAVCRFLMGTIPCFPKMSFPLPTLLINLIGAFAIGLIAQFAAQKGLQNENLILFLKVGVCGGFTTFSTFSLETITLFSNEKTALALLYIALSILLCLLGVLLGQYAAQKFA